MKRTILAVCLSLCAAVSSASTITFPASLNCKNYECQACTDTQGNNCQPLSNMGWSIGGVAFNDGVLPLNKITLNLGMKFAMADYGSESLLLDSPRSIALDGPTTQINNPNFYMSTPVVLACSKSAEACKLYTK